MNTNIHNSMFTLKTQLANALPEYTVNILETDAGTFGIGIDKVDDAFIRDYIKVKSWGHCGDPTIVTVEGLDEFEFSMGQLYWYFYYAVKVIESDDYEKLSCVIPHLTSRANNIRIAYGENGYVYFGDNSATFSPIDENSIVARVNGLGDFVINTAAGNFACFLDKLISSEYMATMDSIRENLGQYIISYSEVK